uniref:Uncharacterized protein n=1 Tax=Setaria viridis TaxID=4556 RepID=A0A4V6D0Z9_SETVI|nr:hypothetical protein SEVIR_9G175600v2 [Setaria viridis]
MQPPLDLRCGCLKDFKSNSPLPLHVADLFVDWFSTACVAVKKKHLPLFPTPLFKSCGCAYMTIRCSK